MFDSSIHSLLADFENPTCPRTPQVIQGCVAQLKWNYEHNGIVPNEKLTLRIEKAILRNYEFYVVSGLKRLQTGDIPCATHMKSALEWIASTVADLHISYAEIDKITDKNEAVRMVHDIMTAGNSARRHLAWQRFDSLNDPICFHDAPSVMELQEEIRQAYRAAYDGQCPPDLEKDIAVAGRTAHLRNATRLLNYLRDESFLKEIEPKKTPRTALKIIADRRPISNTTRKMILAAAIKAFGGWVLEDELKKKITETQDRIRASYGGAGRMINPVMEAEISAAGRMPFCKLAEQGLTKLEQSSLGHPVMDDLSFRMNRARKNYETGGVAMDDKLDARIRQAGLHAANILLSALEIGLVPSDKRGDARVEIRACYQTVGKEMTPDLNERINNAGESTPLLTPVHVVRRLLARLAT